MNHNPIIVGLDIGTTKIVAIAGRKNEYGKLEILGFGRAPSNGVEHGMVLNIEQAVRSIQTAIANCLATNPNLEINEVYVGIAGHHVKSLQTRGDIVRQTEDFEITQAEVDLLIANQRKTFIPAGDQIIDVIPQEFTVDNIKGIPDPVGYGGVRLGASFHIITGDKNAIKNINRAVERTNLKIKDLILQPIASSAAVICEDDLEAGVAIVDIGGGTTDLAIFHEGILMHTAVIPFGGENITNDIKQGLGVLKAYAEQLKVQFGGALANEANANAYVSIPGLKGAGPRDVSIRTLSNIIQARMSEILDFVCYHIKLVGLDARKLNGGIVLTGGGAQLRHLVQLTEYATGMNARIGFPNEHLAAGQTDELANPMYSTCIGMILKGYHEFEKRRINDSDFIKISSDETVAEQAPVAEVPTTKESNEVVNEAINNNDSQEAINVTKRSRLKSFMDKIKVGVIDLFKEEDEKL